MAKYPKVKIEPSDIPEEMAKLINSTPLFGGEETVIHDTGFGLCERIAKDLEKRMFELRQRIDARQAMINEIAAQLPQTQPNQADDLRELEYLRSKYENQIDQELRIASPAIQKTTEALRLINLKISAYNSIASVQQGFKKLFKLENEQKGDRDYYSRVEKVQHFFENDLPKTLRQKHGIPEPTWVDDYTAPA